MFIINLQHFRMNTKISQSKSMNPLRGVLNFTCIGTKLKSHCLFLLHGGNECLKNKK